MIFRLFLYFLGLFIFLEPALELAVSYLNINLSIHIISLVLFLITILLLVFSFKTISINKVFILYSFMLLFILIFFSSLNTRVYLLSYIKVYYFRVIKPFIILFSFYLIINHINYSKFIKLNYFISSILSMIILTYNYTIQSGIRPENALMISDRLAFLSILLFNLVENKLWKSFQICVSLTILILYSSFTTVISFLIVLTFNILLLLLIEKKVIIKQIVFMIIIVLSSSIMTLYNILSNEIIVLSGNGLIINTLNKLLIRLHMVINGNDGSQIGRKILLNEGMKILRERPLVGEFLYEVRVFGSTGSYIHNFLSYWAEFGLVAFIMIFLPFYYYIYRSYNIYRLYNDRVARSLCFSSIYIAFVFIISRAYATDVLWIPLAMLMSYCIKFKKLKNEY